VVGAGISFRDTEVAVFIFTEVVALSAVWFSTVLRRAFHVCWMTVRSFWSVADLFICSTLWIISPAAHVVGAGISFRDTEVAVFIFAEVVALSAVWFSAVMGWALLVYWMAIRPIRPVAHLAVVPAVRLFAAMLPLTEASLHVAESIGPAFFGRRTWGAALALAEAIESIEAGAIGITGWNFDIAIRDAVVDL
jgi:hypothetical protein